MHSVIYTYLFSTENNVSLCVQFSNYSKPILDFITSYQSKDKCLTEMNFSCSCGRENYKLYSCIM